MDLTDVIPVQFNCEMHQVIILKSLIQKVASHALSHSLYPAPRYTALWKVSRTVNIRVVGLWTSRNYHHKFSLGVLVIVKITSGRACF